ncbi:MAG: hypothetical protein ACTHJN_20270 [Ginsengibacter sp.]
MVFLGFAFARPARSSSCLLTLQRLRKNKPIAPHLLARSLICSFFPFASKHRTREKKKKNYRLPMRPLLVFSALAQKLGVALKKAFPYAKHAILFSAQPRCGAGVFFARRDHLILI